MGQMIQLDDELIRINTSKNCIEYSNNNGRGWHNRCAPSTIMGTMQDLTENGKELLLTTSKGLYYSNNKGRGWHKRS